MRKCEDSKLNSNNNGILGFMMNDLNAAHLILRSMKYTLCTSILVTILSIDILDKCQCLECKACLGAQYNMQINSAWLEVGTKVARLTLDCGLLLNRDIF